MTERLSNQEEQYLQKRKYSMVAEEVGLRGKWVEFHKRDAQRIDPDIQIPLIETVSTEELQLYGMVLDSDESYRISDITDPYLEELNHLTERQLCQHMSEKGALVSLSLFDNEFIIPKKLTTGSYAHCDFCPSPWGTLRVQFNDTPKKEDEHLIVTTLEPYISPNNEISLRSSFFAQIYMDERFIINQYGQNGTIQSRCMDNRNFSLDRDLITKTLQLMNFYLDTQEKG